MNTHPSVYETVTQSIIEELKHNLVPWVRPWKSAASTFPRNAISQRPHSGVNILLLWATAAEREYVNPAWLTFKQAAGLGGSVKYGEKATAILYASTLKKKEINDAGEEVEKDISFLKFYNVFNLEQTCGLPEHLYAIPEQKPIGARLFHVEVFLRRVGADVQHGGDKAYYCQSAPNTFH